MMKIKGITIHNTGNRMSARENYELLKNSGKLNICHYLVDDKIAKKTWSIKKPAYHTGKGYDKGNMNTIAIEICYSKCSLEEYLKAEEKAVELVKKLMKQYGLKTSDIYFHRDFNSVTNCPHRIYELYGNKANFIAKYFGGEEDV